MAKTLKIPYESVEILSVGVVADNDPSSFAVSIALGTDPDTPPISASFRNASWKPGGPFILEVNDKYQKVQVARVMISNENQGGTLKFASEGDYYAWVLFTDGQQAIVRNAGKIRVT